MTDDERIARLTELARRVPHWPPGARVVYVREHDHMPTASVVYYAEHLQADAVLLEVVHRDALDALEAALLVLAGEVEAGVADRRQSPDTRDGALCRDREGSTPAWVEKLAGLDFDATLRENANRLGVEVRTLTAVLDAFKQWQRAKGQP